MSVKISAFVTAVSLSLPHPTRAEAVSGASTSEMAWNGDHGAQEPLLAPRGTTAQGDPPAASACRTLTGRDVSAQMAPLCLNTQIDPFVSVLLCIRAVSLRNMFFPVHPDACLAAPAELFFVLQICLTYCFSLVRTFICLPVSIGL